MTESIEIYGTSVFIHPTEGAIEVENWGTEVHSDQYWRKAELPAFFDKVEYDKDGNLILTPQQEEYAKKEVERCKRGFYFLNNGKVTYITGKHYFYLQHWKLEDDIYAEYRDTDRRYFLFLNHWEHTLWCIGVIRGKKRREGASSQATANLIYECIFFKNSVCGLVSKTEKDGKKTFSNMVAFGYRQLPVFLKPNQLNNKDSVSELVFANKSSNTKSGSAKTIDNDTGHRSSVDYRAPGKNTYDSGRLSRGLFDEGAKWEKENPFSSFISIVSKTMVKGAKRVGFMECPSTVNEMTKSGGDEYKKVWNSANQFKYDRTPNRLVRYFTPAFDGYVGFIDKYGMSVIDEPTPEQYKFLVENFVGIGDLTEEDIKLGAKKYLLTKRKDLSGTELEEEIRMNPFDEGEMFMFAGTGCEFSSINIKKQMQNLEDDPVFLRRVRLVLNKKTVKSIFPGQKDKDEEYVSYMDDEKGGWLLLEEPEKKNNFSRNGEYIEPLNKLTFQIGVDTTKDDFAANGSKPTICVMKQSVIKNGTETGMYPVMLYVDKTRLDVHFDEEVLKACMFFGCSANYEIDARTDFYRFFWKRGADRMLEWTPKVAQDPVKNKPLKPGTQSGDPFQLNAQLQICKMYIDGTDMEEYNGHVHRIKFPTLLKQLLEYDHSDRTKSDQVIALMMSLLPILGPGKRSESREVMPRKLLPTYKIVQYN